MSAKNLSLFLMVLLASILFTSMLYGQTEAQKRSWAGEIIYFVLIDRFADGDPSNNVEVDISQKGFFHGGDLVGLTQKLDYLKNLGITAIWINPIVKNIDTYVDEVGFPDWAYHGYWADDFYSLDSRFGTESVFKDFVNQAHAMGIKVLLDVVYNHAGYKSKFLKWPDANSWLRTGRRESLCGDDDLTSCVAGLPDFKTEKPEVADYLLKAQLGWASKSKVDGFRLDTVKHVDHPFWKEHRARTQKKLGPDFFLLGEVWGADFKVMDDYFSNDEMDAGFDFSFKGNAMGFVLGRGRTIAFSRYLLKRHQIRNGYYMVHYLSSHDEPGTLSQLKGNKAQFKLCAVLQFTSIGIPVIYYGEEVGRLGGDWPENRSDMPWGEENTLPGKGQKQDIDMMNLYQKLIAIRKNNPSLSQGDYKEISTEGDLLVFSRNTEVESVFVAINRSDQKLPARVTIPDSFNNSVCLDLLSGDPIEKQDGIVTFDVPAMQARLIGIKPEKP